MRKKILAIYLLIVFITLTFSSCSLKAPRDFFDIDIHSPLKPTNWLLYIPNRILDVLDIFSAGVTLGPGLYLKIQPTRIVKFVYPMPGAVLKLGWNTHYLEDLNPKNPFYLWKRYKLATIGMDGKKSVPFLGFIELGDAMEIKTSPDEFNFGIHFLLVGANIGIRPVDIIDVATSALFIDLNNDDLRFNKKDKDDD